MTTSLEELTLTWRCHLLLVVHWIQVINDVGKFSVDLVISEMLLSFNLAVDLVFEVGGDGTC